MEEKKKSNIIKTVICVVVMAVLVVGYYIYISNKDFRTQSSKDKEKETIETLLAIDLEKEYPSNPREVVTLYSDLICCAYNDELTEEQTDTLSVQLRTLFDLELLEQNSLKEYTENLKTEIAEYKNNKKTISSYQVSKNSEIKFQEMDSQDYAILSGYYRVKTKKSNPVTTCEEFLLRKDKEGYWRILGWELSNGKILDNNN